MSEKKANLKFLKTFFIILGIIFAIFIIMVIGAVIALIIIKPYGLDVTKLPSAYMHMKTGESSYDHPMMTTEQEIFLESMGIDPATVPTEISPSQEQCSVEALGQARVDAIKAGAEPTVDDYLKAKHCFE